MLGQKEELKIRQWAREEYDKKEAIRVQNRQDACEHLVSGSIKDGILTCDYCDKILTREDEWYPESRTPIEQRYVDHADKVKDK